MEVFHVNEDSRARATTVVEYSTIMDGTQTLQTFSGDFLDERESLFTVMVIATEESTDILPHQLHHKANMSSVGAWVIEKSSIWTMYCDAGVPLID